LSINTATQHGFHVREEILEQKDEDIETRWDIPGLVDSKKGPDREHNQD
jgi:hypothetical protein